MPALRIIGDGLACCSKCNEVKNIEQDFMLVNNRRRLAAGMTRNYRYRLSYCRDCLSAQLREAESSPETYIRRRYLRTKKRAEDHGLTFTITLKQWCAQFDKQHGLCFYTDEPLQIELGKGKLSRRGMSADKIVPELGYINGNVVFCSYRVNTMKNDCTLDEMRRWMTDWYHRIMEKLTTENLLCLALEIAAPALLRATDSTPATA